MEQSLVQKEKVVTLLIEYFLLEGNTTASSDTRDAVNKLTEIKNYVQVFSLFNHWERYGPFSSVLKIERCKEIYSFDHSLINNEGYL